MGTKETRILVVEDEAIVALDISSQLEDLGYEVTGLCSSGPEACAAVTETPVDIALMDINLKGEMDGIDTAAKLKSDFDIPVIFITAYADEQTLSRAKIVEPLGYLIKPFDFSSLESTLEISLYKYQMEKRLRESENRYRLISELISDFAFSLLLGEGNSLKLEWLTDAFTHLTGYDTQSIEASDLLEKIVMPKDRKPVRDHINQTIEGKTSTFEYQLETNTGDVRWIRTSLRPVFDKTGAHVERLVGASSDITAQKNAERQIRQLSQAVEQSPSTVVITDIDGKIQYVNPKFEELTGYSAEEVVGEYPHILNSGQHTSEFYQQLWGTIQNGKIWRGTFLNRRKDGTHYWESAAISPLRDEKGEVLHYIKVAADITETVKATEALQQRTEELQTINKELDAFAHTVAHDIQSELSVIIGFSELLLDLDIPNELDTVRNALEIMYKRAKKITTITKSLLLLASARLADVALTPLSMSDIVADVLQGFSTNIDPQTDEIITPDDLPNAMGYGPWIEQVWANYISNAMKYGGDPVRIELGADENCEDGFVRYWVKDNGKGLKDTDKDHLFIPFSRLGLHQGIAGHGLGLSIVERIITRLGGQVGAESTGVPGEGSTFYFTLKKVDPPLG